LHSRGDISTVQRLEVTDAQRNSSVSREARDNTTILRRSASRYAPVQGDSLNYVVGGEGEGVAKLLGLDRVTRSKSGSRMNVVDEGSSKGGVTRAKKEHTPGREVMSGATDHMLRGGGSKLDGLGEAAFSEDISKERDDMPGNGDIACGVDHTPDSTFSTRCRQLTTRGHARAVCIYVVGLLVLLLAVLLCCLGVSYLYIS